MHEGAGKKTVPGEKDPELVVFGSQEKRRRIIAGESQKKQNCCNFRIIAFRQTKLLDFSHLYQ